MLATARNLILARHTDHTRAGVIALDLLTEIDIGARGGEPLEFAVCAQLTELFPGASLRFVVSREPDDMFEEEATVLGEFQPEVPEDVSPHETIHVLCELSVQEFHLRPGWYNVELKQGAEVLADAKLHVTETRE